VVEVFTALALAIFCTAFFLPRGVRRKLKMIGRG